MLSATRKNYRAVPRAQSGFSLIEAMIAGVILAIGLLGIVSLLAMSTVSQHEGIQRVRAVSLADDIIERMRRNPAGLAVYDRGYSAPLDGSVISTQPSPDCDAGACTATELANHDLWVWEQMLAGASETVTDTDGNVSNTAGLRSVRACIEFVADTGKTNTGIVDVALQWQGLKDSSDAIVSGGTTCGDDGDSGLTRRQIVVSSYLLDETEL